jgi:ATP-dependent Lon protease
VLIPRDNARHLEELPPEVREQLTIHLVAHMDDVIRLALVRPPVPCSMA